MDCNKQIIAEASGATATAAAALRAAVAFLVADGWTRTISSSPWQWRGTRTKARIPFYT